MPRPGAGLSPEFEFRQPPDERAELLVLLGWKGWALICSTDRSQNDVVVSNSASHITTDCMSRPKHKNISDLGFFVNFF